VISEKFRAALDAEDASGWLVTLDDENIDYIRGCRRGIEMTLRTIRDQYTGLMISVEEDGSVGIGYGLTESIECEEDLAPILAETINEHQGDDDAIRALSAFLRAQADECDKAIGLKWSDKRACGEEREKEVKNA
jgi:hypothetical protein